jgi:hypothetical protein
MSALVDAAARGISRPPVLLPLGGAALLATLATPVLDEPAWATTVLRGALLLLALAVAGAVDEPEARLLDASPTPFRARVLGRLLVALAAAAPVALALAWWVGRREGVDGGQAVLELAGLSLVALALSAGLRRWTALGEPALLTGPLMIVGLLLGRWLAPYLPDPGLSARQGWAVGVALGVAVLALALRDPASAAQVRLPRRA